jgi:hypothetical protein
MGIEIGFLATWDFSGKRKCGSPVIRRGGMGGESKRKKAPADAEAFEN